MPSRVPHYVATIRHALSHGSIQIFTINSFLLSSFDVAKSVVALRSLKATLVYLVASFVYVNEVLCNQRTHWKNGSFINRKSKTNGPLFLVNGQPESVGHFFHLFPCAIPAVLATYLSPFSHLRSFRCVPLYTDTINPSPMFYSISSPSFSLPSPYSSRRAATPTSSSTSCYVSWVGFRASYVSALQI
jgi:hypothetical protein